MKDRWHTPDIRRHRSYVVSQTKLAISCVAFLAIGIWLISWGIVEAFG